VCPAAPRSQLRPEAGPCRRSASAAPRAGAQRSDVHFRGLSVIGTSGVSRVGEGPRTAGTRRPPVQDRITHPGRLRRPRANHSQPCGAARRSTCPFSLPCRHPRQHRDVLAPMCIACALHTRLSAHTTPTLPPPRAQAGGTARGSSGTTRRSTCAPSIAPAVFNATIIAAGVAHRRRRRSLAASTKRHRPSRSRSRSVALAVALAGALAVAVAVCLGSGQSPWPCAWEVAKWP
jgi:hypothetical protein